jgi:pyruvate/2-oxoglutarate dehydrogenase complex dihydrolipoamide acyltransferase (E2) component
MHGLGQVDVTDVLDRLGPDESITAFVIASVGRAVAQHPAVHAYRDFRGRLVEHSAVDVTTMVEVATSRGPFPLAHVVRGAEKKSVAAITTEIRSVKDRPHRSRYGRWLDTVSASVSRVPLVATVFYWVVARSVAMRRQVGTVTVSSVGMYLGGSGFGIGVPTIMPLTVLVGAVAERPWVVDGEVMVRRVLDLTITIDHVTVDGGPAARFGATLRELLESGAVLEG